MQTSISLNRQFAVEVALCVCAGLIPLGTCRGGEAELRKRPAILDARPVEVPEGADKLQKLLTARYNMTHAELGVRYSKFKKDPIKDADPLMDAVERLLHAGLDLYPRPADRVRFLQQMGEMSRHLVKYIELSSKVVPEWHAAHLPRVQALDLDIEYRLEKAKQAGGKQGK
jgi:hypothetical protein